MLSVLNELEALLPNKNDRDAYLYELVQYALMKIPQKPNPLDYGIG
jgi:hypothetical protein